MIAESLNIPKTVVLRILEEDLGKRKLCARFFPTVLGTWAKERSRHILPRHYRVGRCRQKFLTKLLWVMRPVFLPMTPQQGDRYLLGLVRQPLGWKKLKFQRSRLKNKLIIFFWLLRSCAQRIRTRGKTVNAEYYKRVIDRLLKRIQRVRPAAFWSRDFFLLHDNAPAHKAASFCQFLSQTNVTTLYHYAYSPYLSPPDYFLFPSLKMKLKGLLFADAVEIQETVTDELK